VPPDRELTSSYLSNVLYEDSELSMDDRHFLELSEHVERMERGVAVEDR
jgi:hypothetical protein